MCSRATPWRGTVTWQVATRPHPLTGAPWSGFDIER
jgi:hypothetical protein